VLTLWSDSLLMECNAEATLILLNQESCQKWVMKMLPAVILCLWGTFSLWNCCFRPPVHHNLIRLHIFIPLLQCSCFLTPTSSQRKMCHTADSSKDTHHWVVINALARYIQLPVL